MNTLHCISAWCLIVASGISAAFAQTASPDQEKAEQRQKEFDALCDIAADGLTKLENFDRNTFVRDLTAYAKNGDSLQDSFAVVKLAWLTGQPALAITTLEETMKKHGDEPEPQWLHLNTGLTMDFHCNFWIASVARQYGDAQRAQRAYDALLKKMRNDPKIELLAMPVLLYRSEMEYRMCDHPEEALATLRKIKNVSPPTDADHRDDWDLTEDWAAFMSLVVQGKGKEADASLRPNEHKVSNTAIMARGVCDLVGILMAEAIGPHQNDSDQKNGNLFENRALAMAMDSKTSEIDRTMARLVVADGHWTGGDYSAAGENFSAIFKDRSFFSPEAGLELARCQKKSNHAADAEATLRALQERFPAYKDVVERALRERE